MNENNFCNKIYEKVLQVINMKSIYEFSMGCHTVLAWIRVGCDIKVYILHCIIKEAAI